MALVWLARSLQSRFWAVFDRFSIAALLSVGKCPRISDMFLSERKYAFPCLTLPATLWAYARSTYFYHGSRVIEKCGCRVSVRRAHADFCFGPPAESLVCVLRISVEVTADEVDYFLFFHLFISSYCLGKRIDFRSVEFLVFSPSRIYRSRRHSSGAALPRPTGQFQIL
jgi:hypothetical protein